MQETWARSLGWEDPLEKGNATHSSILAWRIPRTIPSMGLQRVGHDRVTFTSLHYAEVRALQGVGFMWGSNSSFIPGIVLAYTCHSDIIIDKASSHSQKCSSLDNLYNLLILRQRCS